jgi:predicted permease
MLALPLRRTFAIAGALGRDARDAVRGMRRRPGFTAGVLLTLALGIGVNGAALAVAYGILVQPLPYRDPAGLVVLNLLFTDGGDLGFAPDAVRQWLPRLSSAQAAAAYYSRDVTILSGSRSTVAHAAFVTDRFFDVFGVPAWRGRAELPEGERTVVMGQRGAAEMLGAEPAQQIARAVTVSDSAHTVVGLMPLSFAFPTDETVVWLPSPVMTPGGAPGSGGYSRIVARLRPGVTLAQFRDEADRIRRELDPHTVVSVTAVGASVVEATARLLVAAVAGTLLVLLVACANVATLLVGRDVARRREFATRLAVGAGRGTLVRSLLVDTFAIALAASVLGLALASVALTIFVRAAASTIPGLYRVHLGTAGVLGIAVSTFIVTFLCGAAPAWHAARGDFSVFLRPTSASRPRAWRLRGALVVAQIACASVLLIGAGLLARTVSVIAHEDHGFDADRALAAKIVMSDSVLIDGAGRAPFVGDLLERVRALPGVRAAGLGSNLPPRTPPVKMSLRLVTDRLDQTRFMYVGSATPGFLPALGARFVAGRDFSPSDATLERPVVILSESLARFYFQDRDPIGRPFSKLPALFGITGEPQVIGVVRDITYEGLDQPAGSSLYLPWSGRAFGSGYLIVRTDGDPAAVAGDVRTVVRVLDTAVPVAEIQTLPDVLAQSLAARRMRALPALGFALLAVMVALVGVFATLATLATERRRDLGIRAALGASPARLMWSIASQGLVLTALGLAIGLCVSGATARALASLLYHVSPYDGRTFAAASVLVAGGAAVMTFAAALRTLRVDSVAVLRQE